MKYLIVGLGNIGSEYEDTRHNIGFSVLDALARASSAVFSQDRLAYHSEIKFKGRTLVLIKPTTYMNLSGKAVNYWLQHEKIQAENMMVVTDDLALPFGKIRIRPAGSDGGHNGLKDIQATLGHANYPRLRFGIGAEFSKGKQVDYVLGKWSEEELKTLSARIDLACEAIKTFAAAGLQHAMNGYNNK
ncbi:MAG: aminoacyl-tRNA hydrolase [Flavobacteriales bacterium]|nr:aminoacyl-tRNA hydrolase [Flavobacteriales bacterium]